MRKTILGILFMLPVLGFSQAGGVVVAPNTDILLAEEAFESKLRFVEQMKLALEQSKALLEAKEAIEKVSNVVKTSIQVKRLTANQQECYETIEWVVNDIDVNDYANAIVENSATEVIDLTFELEDNIASTTKILSNDFFKMKDAERLKFVRELNAEVTQIENKLYRLKRKNKRYSELYQYYNELAKKDK